MKISNISMLQSSNDGSRWAGVTKGEAGKACVVDGDVHGSHKRVRRPAFTSDNRVVYVAVEKEGECVVVDGAEGPRTAKIVELAVGGAIAYIAKTGKGFDVTVNGELVGTFTEAGDIAVDAYGNVAFWGSVGKKEVLYFNGEQHAQGNNIQYPAISATGSLAYLTADKHWQVVKGDDAFGPYDWALPPRWSANGARVVAPIKLKDRWSLCIDGQVTGDHDDIGKAYAVTDDGYAYAAADNNNWQVLGSTGTAGPFDSVSTVSIASDGTFAAVGRRDDGLYVATPDAEYGPFRQLGETSFQGKDGLAFWATNDDGCRLWLAGKPVSDAFESMTNPVFDGANHVVFAFDGDGVRRIEL